jgi:hypothetical protein
MADNALTVVDAGSQTKTLRSVEMDTNVHGQVVLVGEFVRVYDGVQSLSLSGTAQSLTVPGTATHAYIVCEGSAAADYARVWHGATPTSSVGIKLFDGQGMPSAAPEELEAIVGSGTLTLRIEYYHYA